MMSNLRTNNLIPSSEDIQKEQFPTILKTGENFTEYITTIKIRQSLNHTYYSTRIKFG